MSDDPCADLHQPVAQRGERPVLDLLRQPQGVRGVGEVVGQRVQLQPHCIDGERQVERMILPLAAAKVRIRAHFLRQSTSPMR